MVVLGLGVALMFVQAKASPAFFRGEVLSKADASDDTGALQVFDDGLDG